MFHAIQAEAAYYGLILNLTKTFLIRAGAACLLPRPNLNDIHRKAINMVDYEKSLGFNLAPNVRTQEVLKDVAERC